MLQNIIFATAFCLDRIPLDEVVEMLQMVEDFVPRMMQNGEERYGNWRITYCDMFLGEAKNILSQSFNLHFNFEHVGMLGSHARRGNQRLWFLAFYLPWKTDLPDNGIESSRWELKSFYELKSYNLFLSKYFLKMKITPGFCIQKKL